MKAVPVDVMRDMENRIGTLRSLAREKRRAVQVDTALAEMMEKEAAELEILTDKWKKLFPDTAG